MEQINKNRMVIKALFKKRKEYITANEILNLLEKKINETELKVILNGLIEGYTVLSEPLVIDGSETNIPLYTLSNNYLMYLDSYIKAKTPNQIRTNTEQPNPEIKLKSFAEIKQAENKFMKGMPMEKVIDHFKVMTEKKSKNNIPYLDNEKLISFLQRAFLNDTKIPKQRFNLANGEKGFVIKRFYDFFDYAVTQYNELNNKKKYIELLSDNFDNWEYKSIVSFFKPNKTRKKW